MELTFNSLLNCDSYNYEYFLQGDVCRLCWKRNSFGESSSNLVNLNGVKIEIIDVIRECLELEICDDRYPNKVCDQCWDVVKKFYCFKNYCKEADKKLREIIDNGCQTAAPITDNVDIKAEVKNEFKSDIFDSESFVDIKIKKPSQSKVAKAKQKVKKSANYCYICCTEFDNEKQFKNHNSDCHGIESGLYKCFGCEKQFKNSRTRTSHETNFCKALKQGYKCKLCDRFLPLRKLYEAHMRYHAGKEADVSGSTENIFKCRKCDQSFKSKDNLKEHMVTHVTVDNHFVCETCGNVFQRQDYLQKHILIHMGVKRHICTYCGLRFVQKSSLNVHLRKHTGERPYKCDVCPQRCVSSSNLRAHRKRHLGIKQFECAICSKKFGYKKSLAEHIASTHAPAQKHQCNVCGATYARKRCLKRHLAKKHGEKPEDNVQNIELLVNL